MKCGCCERTGTEAGAGLAAGARELVLGQPAGLAHPAQDPLLAFAGAGKVPERVEPGRRLGQAGQEGAFGGARITQRFGKVEFGGPAAQPQLKLP